MNGRFRDEQPKIRGAIAERLGKGDCLRLNGSRSNRQLLRN